MNHRFLKGALALSLLAGFSSVEAKDLITAEDPEAILEIAKGFGSARLKTDSQGDPLIVGRIDGTRYGIYFYGCDDNHRHCDDIKFGAAWSGKKISLKELNNWNRTKRYGTAYQDSDGDPNLDMPVNLDYGVTVENLEDDFSFWEKVIKAFKREVLKI